MRKLVITFTMLFAVISLMAQEHLSFKGIPIEGSMTAFCQKLKAKGFTSIGSENNLTCLQEILQVAMRLLVLQQQMMEKMFLPS